MEVGVKNGQVKKAKVNGLVRVNIVKWVKKWVIGVHQQVQTSVQKLVQVKWVTGEQRYVQQLVQVKRDLQAEFQKLKLG